MPTKTFTVAGLTCIDCAARVQAAVSQVEGVSGCQVDHAAGTLTVSCHTMTMPDLPSEQIARAVSSTGYTLVTERRSESRPVLGFLRFVLSKRETTLTAVAALLTLLGLALSALLKASPAWGGASLAVAGAPPWSRTLRREG